MRRCGRSSARLPTGPTSSTSAGGRAGPAKRAPGGRGLGARTFERGELAVMAIINRTPDSFFDHGATFVEDAALRAVERAVADGADIIDIGGVKAGPGNTVDVDEELRRTISTVAAVRKSF